MAIVKPAPPVGAEVMQPRIIEHRPVEIVIGASGKSSSMATIGALRGARSATDHRRRPGAPAVRAREGRKKVVKLRGEREHLAVW